MRTKKDNDLTLDTIKKRLDTLLKVVRYQGSIDGETNRCATCGETFPIKELQCGHFVKRGDLALKYKPTNLMAQCRRCNHFLDGAQDKAAYYIIKHRGLDEFNLLVETDFKWLRGEIAPPKKQDYVQAYNVWLQKNRMAEIVYEKKIIPGTWKPIE